MQIALVAVVLLAGMWFTVLKPKPDAGPAAPKAQPTAPGAAGLARAVNSAKGASAASDAANARIQQATGGSVTTPAVAAKPAVTKAVAATKKPATAKQPATAKAVAKPAAKPATDSAVDPSTALLRVLAKGKTVVLLFHGDGADDLGARKAVHRVARSDKNVVAAYADIDKVADYRAITTDVEVATAPTILVIGKDRKALALTGFVDAGVVRQTVGDVRRAAAAAAKK